MDVCFKILNIEKRFKSRKIILNTWRIILKLEKYRNVNTIIMIYSWCIKIIVIVELNRFIECIFDF